MALTTDQKVDKIIEFLEMKYGPNAVGDKETPVPPIVKPEEGVIKPGGWGAADNPNTWKVTKMRDFPDLFKVVDLAQKNVITNFSTEAIAQQYIDYHKSKWEEEDDPQAGEPSAEEKPPEPTEPKPAEGQDGPYKALGKELPCSQRGPTVRHYASGADDDKTIEKNCKGIKARNHQFITYVTIKSIEHDDTMSQKIGGRHMNEGWFVASIEFESGLCGIGLEKKHPSTSHNDVKGPKIGSILNKKIGMASVYFADSNKVELWTDTGDGKWVKQCEGTNIKGFNPKAKEFECQLRIDGFDDLPEISKAVVQEIAV